MSILSSLLSIGQGTPTQQIPTAVQTTEIAKEVAPFIKDILGKGQALYKQRMDEGFVPFEGQTLADVTADQLAVQEGLRGLVGSQAAGIQEARDLTRGQTQQATTEALQPFMNPYQQAVTDISKRTAQERFESETLPGLRKQAIDAGAFGGSRAAMRESQAQDAQARLLADIQAKGDLSAFQNAQKQFEAQKTRERFAAEGLSGLTGAEFGARKEELAGLQAVGAEDQKRQQQLLDESYKRFLDERRFPEQQLGQYQGFVSGASPFLKSTETRMGPQQFQDSPVEKALKLAGTGLGTYKTADGLGLFSKEGGGIEQGLASLPVVQREEGQQVLNLRKPYDEPGFVSQGERIAEKIQNLPGAIKDFLGSIIGPTEKQKEQRADLDQYTIDATGTRNRLAREKAFDKSGEDDLDTFRKKQIEDAIQQQEFDAQVEGLDSATIPNESEANKTNVVNTEPKIKGNVKKEGDAPGIDKKGLPSIREALLKKEGLYSNLDKSLTARMNARLANIKSSKEAAKAQAQIDFLMGFGRGKRDPNDPSAFAGLAASGQEAVAATADFNNQIAKLDSQELDVLDANIQDKFNIESEKLNLAFKNGEITRQEFNDKLAERKVVAQELLAGKNVAYLSLDTIKGLIKAKNNMELTQPEFLNEIKKELKAERILSMHLSPDIRKQLGIEVPPVNTTKTNSKLMDTTDDDISKEEITVG